MQPSALRSLAIVCDHMETTLFAIVCDLRSAIVCDYMQTSLKLNSTDRKGPYESDELKLYSTDRKGP